MRLNHMIFPILYIWYNSITYGWSGWGLQGGAMNWTLNTEEPSKVLADQLTLHLLEQKVISLWYNQW